MLLIQRLALLLFFALPAFLPNTAMADYPKTLTRYELTGWGQSNSTYEALCSYFLNVKQTAYPNETIVIASCTETGVLLQGSDYYNNGIKKYGSCNGVETLWGSGICEGEPPPPTCTPPLVLNPTTNQCESTCPPKKGQQTPYFKASPSASDSCVAGCLVAMIDGSCGTNTSGAMGCFYTGEFTGADCTAATSPAGTPPPPSPEYDCIKSGKSYGTVNGAVVCVPAGTPASNPITSQTAGTKVTTTDANGVETTTAGPVQTVTTTGDANGVPVVTVETVNADGTKIKTAATKASYCEENPNSQLCKAEQTCVATPNAPVCKHLCEKYPNSIACQEKTSFFSDLKKSIFGTLEADLASAPADGGIVTQNIELDFAKVALPESMACPPPVSLSFGSHSVSISYDWLCEYADSFRPVVVAFAYMAAIMIVFGAFKKEG
jgi:hypothetical protein